MNLLRDKLAAIRAKRGSTKKGRKWLCRVLDERALEATAELLVDAEERQKRRKRKKVKKAREDEEDEVTDSSEEEELVPVLPPRPPAAVPVQDEDALPTPCLSPSLKVDTGDLPTPVLTMDALAAWQQGDHADRVEPEAEEAFPGPAECGPASVSRTRSRTPTRGCGELAGVHDAG